MEPGGLEKGDPENDFDGLSRGRGDAVPALGNGGGGG
jgi:hypothetical protein